MSGFTDAAALAKKNRDESVDPMMALWMKHGYPAVGDPVTPKPIDDPREYGRGARGPVTPTSSEIDPLLAAIQKTTYEGRHLAEALAHPQADLDAARAQAHAEKDAEITPVVMNALKGAAVPASFLGGPLGVAAGAYLTAQGGLDTINDVHEGNYGSAAMNGVMTAIGARQGYKGVKGMFGRGPGPILPEPGMHWTARQPAETPYHFGGDLPGSATPDLARTAIGSGSGAKTAPMSAEINDIAEQIGRGFNPKQEIEMSRLRTPPMSDVEGVTENVANGGFNPKAEIENMYKLRMDARKMRTSAGLPEGPIAEAVSFEPPAHLGHETGPGAGKMFAAPAPSKSHSTTGTYWADGKEYPMPDVVGKPTPQTDVAFDQGTYKANGGKPKATSSPLADKAGLVHSSDSLQPRVDAMPPGDAIMDGDQADLRRVLFGGLNEHSNTAGHPRPKDRKPISKSMEGLLQMISNIKKRSKEPQL